MHIKPSCNHVDLNTALPYQVRRLYAQCACLHPFQSYDEVNTGRWRRAVVDKSHARLKCVLSGHPLALSTSLIFVDDIAHHSSCHYRH